MSGIASRKLLITAAASGIGYRIARAFAAAGARVHVCDIDPQALADMRRTDPEIGTSLCDVTDRPAVAAMVAEAARALGGIDTLINNAGIAGPTAPLEQTDPEAWDAVLRVNLTGTFDVSRHAIAHLKHAGDARLLIMSSLAGRVGYPNRSAYATSKWGLIGLTKTLSRELGPFGVRVNAILPGAVDGPRITRVLADRAARSGRSPAAEREEELARQSLDHFVDPEHIAALALFLASDAGRSISGQILPIDGDSQGT